MRSDWNLDFSSHSLNLFSWSCKASLMWSMVLLIDCVHSFCDSSDFLISSIDWFVHVTQLIPHAMPMATTAIDKTVPMAAITSFMS